jgi:hypothetical protein
MKTQLKHRLTIKRVACVDGKHFIRFEDGTGALLNRPDSRMGSIFFVRQSDSMPIENAIELGITFTAQLEPEAGLLPLIYGGHDSEPQYDEDKEQLTPTIGWDYYLGTPIESIQDGQ